MSKEKIIIGLFKKYIDANTGYVTVQKIKEKNSDYIFLYYKIIDKYKVVGDGYFPIEKNDFCSLKSNKVYSITRTESYSYRLEY